MQVEIEIERDIDGEAVPLIVVVKVDRRSGSVYSARVVGEMVLRDGRLVRVDGAHCGERLHLTDGECDAADRRADFESRWCCHE